MVLNNELRNRLESREWHNELRAKGLNLEADDTGNYFENWTRIFLRLDEEAREKREQIKQIRKENQSLQNKNNELNTRLLEYLVRPTLEAKIIELENRIINRNNQIKDLQTQNQVQQEEVIRLTELNGNLTDNNVLLEEQKGVLEDNYQALVNQNQGLQNQYNLLDGLKNNLNTTIADYQALGERYQNDTQNLNSLIQKLRAEKTRLGKQIRTIFRNQRKVLTDKLNREKLITKSCQEDKSELLQQNATDRTNFLNALRNKQNKFNNLANQIESLKNDLDWSEEVLENRITTIIRLSNQLNAFIQENSELEQAGERLLIVFQNKETEVISLNQQLTQTQTERNNYLTELNEAVSNIRELEETLADKNAKLAQALTEKNSLQIQINEHVCSPPPHTCPPCPLSHEPTQCFLIHLPEPHGPIVKCLHTDYEELKNRPTELEIVERLNTAFNLNEKDLNGIISKVKELIDKPPLTVDNENIRIELEKAKDLILKLEKEVVNNNVGEDIKEIIKVDDKTSERVVWISLLAVSLLTIGGLLMKLRKGKKLNN